MMWKKYVACLMAAGWMTCVCGCASTELEQRSFPLAVGIDLKESSTKEKEALKKTDPSGQLPDLVVSFDFPDLMQISEKSKTSDTSMGLSLEGADMYHVEKAYENNTNRLLDYNHMKAVILGENIFSSERQLRRLLLAWEQREASARNTSLFVGSSSAAEILTLTAETEGSIGKYLEEMLESQKDFKQDKIATVGDLMNQWHNQDELLLIPVLTEEGERPVITGYAAVLNFEYRGMISVEDAMKVFLSQNLLGKFTCEPTEEDAVEISDIQVSKAIEQQGDTPVVTVSITGQGRMKTGQVSSVSEQYQLERKIEKQLTADLLETAEELREAYEIDMTNSYISLGGHNRKLYEAYKDFPDTYNREAKQVFQVDISLLNWE